MQSLRLIQEMGMRPVKVGEEMEEGSIVQCGIVCTLVYLLLLDLNSHSQNCMVGKWISSFRH